MSQVYYLYAEMLRSNLTNISLFAPVLYDVKMFNSTPMNDTAEIINTILSLKALQQRTAVFQNGSSISNDIFFYGPFQFRTVYLFNATECDSGTHIFNLVTNESEFMDSVYAGLYSYLNASVTNICVSTPTNSCDSGELKGINASFYVN